MSRAGATALRAKRRALTLIPDHVPLTLEGMSRLSFLLAGELASIGSEPDITVSYTVGSGTRTPRRIPLLGFANPAEATVPRTVTGWSLERHTEHRPKESCRTVNRNHGEASSSARSHTRGGFVLAQSGRVYEVIYHTPPNTPLQADALYAPTGNGMQIDALRVTPIEDLPRDSAEANCTPSVTLGTEIDHLAHLAQKLAIFTRQYHGQ